MMCIKKTRNDCHQSDAHGKCFKGNVGETSERWGGTNNGRFSKFIDTIMNRTELTRNLCLD